MKVYTAALASITCYAQGRHHDTPKLEREQAEAYDKRTYLQRLHVAAGQVYIPPMAFKLCLENTARYLGMQIVGKGKSTYTKHFVQGILCNEPMLLGIAPEQVRMERIFTSLTPQRRDGPRGWRHFPVIDSWSGTLPILVIDEVITQDVLKRHLEIGGMITGLGVWRPGKGGLWGKFRLTGLEESEIVV